MQRMKTKNEEERKKDVKKKLLFIQLGIMRIRRKDVDLTCICTSGVSNAF